MSTDARRVVQVQGGRLATAATALQVERWRMRMSGFWFEYNMGSEHLRVHLSPSETMDDGWKW